MRKEKIEGKKNKLLPILLLTILVLIVIIILLLFYYFNHDNKKELTGNTDVFEIICDCNKNDTDKDNSDSNLNTGDSSNNGGLVVNDSDIVWHSTNQIKIFKNPVYEMEEVIAPGSNNVYHFVVKNNSSCDLIYKLNFIEKNKFHINMKYRLKKNGKYIKKSWVSYDDLILSDSSLKYKEEDDYLLEWKWVESSNDTMIGTTPDASYHLDIEIVGKQKI